MDRGVREWDRTSFLEELETRHGQNAVRTFEQFEQRLGERVDSRVTIDWRGSTDRKDTYATMWPYLVYEGVTYRPPVCFRVDGEVEVPFLYMQQLPPWGRDESLETLEATPFSDEDERRKLRDHLQESLGIDLPESVEHRPTFALSGLRTEGAQERLVEVYNWYVGRIGTQEHHPKVRRELEHRKGMWDSFLNAGGPSGVAPKTLRNLGIYGGAQGVWVDKARTSRLTEDATGVTVGLLHTGTSYADDLSDDGVLYHYPSTNRPKARDLAEIEATKAAGRLGLPVFVITYPSPGSAKRDVHLGWVESWDDSLEIFLITFGDSPPSTSVTEPEEQPFRLIEERITARRHVQTRIGQQRFKFQVFKRYGGQCAVCGISAPQLLDAAHLRPKKDHGSDDPRNGLVLCASHHRALDAGLFAIEPISLRICCRESGPDAHSLRMDYSTLEHLHNKPHAEAIEWLWSRWWN